MNDYYHEYYDRSGLKNLDLMNEEPPLNRGISWAIDKNFSDEENNLADSDY